MMLNKRQQERQKFKTSMSYVTSEMRAVMQRVAEALDDKMVSESLHFSPTALATVRRALKSGGHLITDTPLTKNDVDAALAKKLQVSVRCFLDDSRIVEMAESKQVTRAEVALDHALSLDGMKLIAIGSAPTALNRLLKRRQLQSFNDLVVLGMPTGFAGVLQLKEQLWESDIPCIVARGKAGGAAVSVAVINALMAEAVREQNL